MNQPERDREIVVGLRFDEGHQVLVPENLDRALNRSPLLGHRCEPPLDCLSSPLMATAGQPEPQRQAGYAIDDFGRWQHVGSSRMSGLSANLSRTGAYSRSAEVD